MSAGGMRSGTSIETLDSDGSRSPVEGTGIVAVLGDGRELHVDFSRHPMSDGGVMLRSEFVTPGTEYGSPDDGRVPDVFARMTLHPGGGNLMRVGIEAVSREPGGLLIEEGADAPGPGLFAVEKGKRTPIASRTVVLTLRNGAHLMVGVGTAPGQGPADPHALTSPGRVGFHAGLFLTPGQVERAKAGHPFRSSTLQVRFGGANVVHVRVQEHQGVVVTAARRVLRRIRNAVGLLFLFVLVLTLSAALLRVRLGPPFWWGLGVPFVVYVLLGLASLEARSGSPGTRPPADSS